MARNTVWVTVFILGPMLLFLLPALLLPGRKGRRRPGKRQPKTMRALAALIFSCLGLLWLSAVGAMTMHTAVQLGERLAERSRDYADQVSRACLLPEYYDPALEERGYLWKQYEDPEAFRRTLLEGAALGSGLHLPSAGLSLGNARIVTGDDEAFETAVLFLDGEGKPLFDGDVLFFPYVTADAWAAGTTEQEALSFGWVQLPEKDGEDPYRRLREEYRRSGWLRPRVRALRIVADAAEGEIHPLSMDLVTTEAEQMASLLWSSRYWESADPLRLDELDRTGTLEWEHLFGDAGAAGVTLYALDPELYLDETHPLTLRNAEGEIQRYASLGAMLREGASSSLPADRRGLDTVLTVSVRNYRDRREGHDSLDLILLTAVIAHPLRSAVKVLWLTYLLTALLALALGMLMLRLLRRRLVVPVTDVADGMAGEWYNLYSPEGEPAVWREAADLYEGYRAEQDRRRKEENERRRLERALSYAKAAEEERRLLTSNLAHELKTPLAVVHSYAEGLRAHIAEEKREQYLDTILSEAERMDALVMQMLDLSRLEAGKVKLSRDGFDLRAMAEAGVEKLRPLAEERGLTVTLEPGEACEVAADESRIAQVTENLLSNALRYAPERSRVRVRVETEGKQAVFRVENPVERAFTPEEREKVWEPFYRRDKARSGGGTGLGLSIVKQIVELHGGTCGLWNTDGGVEFWFTLPS